MPETGGQRVQNRLAASALAILLFSSQPAFSQEPDKPAEGERSSENTHEETIKAFRDLMGSDFFEKLSNDLRQGSPEEQAPFDTTKPVVGFGISRNEGGMKIETILPGSAAESAGLEVGMTITSINGVMLSGFETSEVVKILGAIPGEIVLNLDDGQTISLIKAPIPQTGE